MIPTNHNSPPSHLSMSLANSKHEYFRSIPSWHVVCWHPPKFFKYAGGTKNTACCARCAFHVSNACLNQRNPSKWMPFEKVFFQLVPNTRFLTFAFLARSHYPIPATVHKYQSWKTSKRQTPSTYKLHIPQPYSKSGSTAPQYKRSFEFTKMSDRWNKCLNPTNAAPTLSTSKLIYSTVSTSFVVQLPR